MLYFVDNSTRLNLRKYQLFRHSNLEKVPFRFNFGIKEGNTGFGVEILTHDFIKILHAIDYRSDPMNHE